MKQISKIITISVISSSIVLGAIPNSSTIQKQIEAPRDIPTQKKEEINIQGVQDNSVKLLVALKLYLYLILLLVVIVLLLVMN